MSSFLDQDEQILVQYDRAEFQRWQTESRVDDAVDTSVVEIFADLLTPVLQFLAEGHKPPTGSRTLEQRAWVLIYALRPDLLDGQSMPEAEEFVSTRPNGRVTVNALAYQMGNFRKVFPLLRINTASRMGKVSDPVKMREVTRKRAISWLRTRDGHLAK